MITGDNALTACQVARDLRIVERPVLFLQVERGEGSPKISAIEMNGKIVSSITPSLMKKLSLEYSFCMDGPSVSEIASLGQTTPNSSVRLLAPFVQYVSVFSRATPEQKELIVLALNFNGEVTIMCGDGTNDVGALRQAHVGVAILSSPLDEPVSITSVPVTKKGKEKKTKVKDWKEQFEKAVSVCDS
jgi:manganese-transporting P-type ATPase